MKKDIQEFVSELRRGIKNGSWSNDRILRQFNDVYKAAYDQGCLDTYTAASRRIQETVNANQVLNPSHNVDGVKFQPDSSVNGAGAGTNADDPNSGSGSAKDVQAAGESEYVGPGSEHPLLDSTSI